MFHPFGFVVEMPNVHLATFETADRGVGELGGVVPLLFPEFFFEYSNFSEADFQPGVEFRVHGFKISPAICIERL